MNKEPNTDVPEKKVIDVSGLSKSFGSRTVLKDINLDVTAAQNICICGANGAGKSTFVRLIAGIAKADIGCIKIYGLDTNKYPEKTRPVLGFISHQSMLYPDLTIYENLLFFARLYGLNNPHDRIVELLEDLGLVSYRYDRTNVLSRGMLQRLSIARAIIHEPSVLLADEPFTGLDTHAVSHLKEVLQNFHNTGGTLLMTTHQPHITLDCCHRVIVLDKGTFIFDSTVSNLDPDAFRRDYLEYARSNA